MAYYRVGDNLYDLDPMGWPNVDLSSVQRALGCSTEKLIDRLDEMDVDAVQAVIWIFRRRTEPGLRVGDVTFTLYEFMAALEFSDDEVRTMFADLGTDEDREKFIEGANVTDDQRERLFADGKLVEVPVPLDSEADSESLTT